MNFLLVDDHSLIVQALSVLLKAKFEGAQVLTGSTAEDARALVREHSEDTDLLILDLNLPGVQTPTSLLEELVQTNPALKILVLSGIVDQANIMRVLQLGAAGFVPKSLDTNMLSDAITFVLQGGVYIPTQLLSQSQKEGFFTEAAVEMQQSTPQRSSRQAHLPRIEFVGRHSKNAHLGHLPRLRCPQPHGSAYRGSSCGL